MTRLLSRVAAIAAVLGITAGPAAAATTGNIQGRVTDQSTGKPLGGVTVTASGPLGEQTEFTDGTGRYLITELPPGEYVVRFYFSNIKVERPGVRVEADKTLSVVVSIPTATAKQQRYVIQESAPVVDVATTQVQTQVTEELVKNTPVGRSYSSILTLAPGSATDPVGFSFNGATGPENQFLVNGLNTTSPADGLLGSPMSLEFIRETEIITGGYNAEFGRSTGGVVNVITKSGSNEFHGGAWLFYTPLMLEPPRISRPGEAIARLQRNVDAQGRPSHLMDFGVDLGGPIVKDRLWFYAGFTPSYSRATYDRILRRRTANELDPTMIGDSYLGDVDKSMSCAPWIRAQNEALCAPAGAGGFKTEDLDPRLWRRFETNTARYQGIGKLNLRINDNHSAEVTYIGAGTTFDGVLGGRFNGNPYTGTFQASQPGQVHDLVAHYVAKLLDRKLQFDVRAGWHFEKSEVTPTELGRSSGQNIDARTEAAARTIYAFEDELEPCKLQKLGMTNNITFNPCPVTNYRDGGYGFEDRSANHRAVVAANATYFLKLLGTHAVKLGGDFEYNVFQNYRAYTGSGATGGAFTTFDSGGQPLVQRQQYATLDPLDPTRVLIYDGLGGRPLGFDATTSTLNESLFLRDSWILSFLPGLTLNLGLRWEAQQVRDITGKTQIGIFDNWAPRLGFAYDVLGKGRSKIFASYGRFYESIPLTINNRQFSGEGFVIQTLAPGEPESCKADANGRVDLTSCKWPTPTREDVLGGKFGIVSPSLQGQYSNDIVIGADVAVGWDLVLGAKYIHRDLGRVIEDISADGGKTYVIANPGSPPDPGTVRGLQNQIDALNGEIRATSDMARQAALRKQVEETSTQLSLYKAAANFERPKRDYDALVLTASKRLSRKFQILASYTYSRTVGNYPGLFQASNGQLDPNISTQYDLPELLVNRNGPLPNDRPHNFKLIGSYSENLGRWGAVTVGLNFFVQSGTPIEVLGRHPTYGANETFVLPRGSGGRTPPLSQFDLRIAYAMTFGKGLRAEVSLDLFNLLNQQEVVAVDQQYTIDNVMPIPNGTYGSLKTLKTTSGTVPRLNPNYGQPTAYQSPMSLRLGARISF